MKSFFTLLLATFLFGGCTNKGAPDWLIGDWVFDEAMTRREIGEIEGQALTDLGGYEFLSFYESLRETTFSFRKNELVELRRGGNGIVRSFRVLEADNSKAEVSWEDGSVSTYYRGKDSSFVIFTTDFTTPTLIFIRRKE